MRSDSAALPLDNEVMWIEVKWGVRFELLDLSGIKISPVLRCPRGRWWSKWRFWRVNEKLGMAAPALSVCEYGAHHVAPCWSTSTSATTVLIGPGSKLSASAKKSKVLRSVVSARHRACEGSDCLLGWVSAFQRASSRAIFELVLLSSSGGLRDPPGPSPGFEPGSPP